MPSLYNRRVTDQEFCQRVRRHKPSALLPLVAQEGSRYWEPQSWLRSPFKKFTPWALAEVTRVSLAMGNEHRQDAEPTDVLECCAAYDGLADPELAAGDAQGLANFFLRIGGQQLSYQQPLFNDLSRTVALFEQTTPARPLNSITQDARWALELLGCSLREYVGTAILLHTSAWRNAGTFSRAWLQAENFVQVLAEVGAEPVQRTLESHFLSDVQTFKSMALPYRGNPQLRRFSYNPLMSKPVVEGLSTDLLIPVPALLTRKVSPLGLYYLGLDEWGIPFAEDVGSLFEAYVGRQLSLSHGSTVIPAISYGKSGEEGIDWIAIFDEAVVLVEVKSVRPTEAIRLGQGAEEELQRMLAKAVDQLNRTAGLVQDRHQAFRDVPTDRPIVGLVVTLEPFHTANMPNIRAWLPDSSMQIAICSAFELESVVCLQEDTVGGHLLAVLSDEATQGWSVTASLIDRPLGQNAVLDEAWATYPWRSEERGTQPQA